MSAREPQPRPWSPAGRAAALILRPRRTWRTIAQEPADGAQLYRRYVGPLAAVPAVCGVIGGLLFGSGIAGIEIRPSVPGLLAEAALNYLFTLIGVWLLALIVAVVAPRFGGRAERGQALKLAAYSGTALWLAGVFALLPSLGMAMMILGGLYSLYLLREGLPVVMRTPEPRSLTCFALIVILALALAIAMGAASAYVRSLVGGPLRVVGGA